MIVKIKNYELFKHSPPESDPSPGLYHYNNIPGFPQVIVHLRIENPENSTLIINGNTVLHLNSTATRMVYYYLNPMSEEEALKKLSRNFRIKYTVLKQDYQQFISSIESVLSNGYACFCDFQDLNPEYPFQNIPIAPYRMDLALTYLCNNHCYHCYNDPDRSFSPLNISQWKEVLDKMVEIGIPHIVFTGGEPTLYPGLEELISYATDKGLITGLNTNGRRLNDNSFVQRLIDSGLDHVQITLESFHSDIHNRIVQNQSAWQETIAGLKNALAKNLFVMTNTTLLRDNTPTLIDTLEYLAELGVPTVGINALIYSGRGKRVENALSDDEVSPILKMAQDYVRGSGQKLIWYTPTAYCHFDPMSLNLGIKGCTAAFYNMCIEPNGSVIPCQSYYISVGNILMDDWNKIWNHPLCNSLRSRSYMNDECKSCILQKECGGGCPLSPIQADRQLVYRMLT